MAEVHDGSIALVTGAAQGIGRATALRLAADGALVAANDREPSRALEEVDQAYGPRVGVHRILDLLRSHGTEATCPVPSCYSPPTWRTGSLSDRASASLRTVCLPPPGGGPGSLRANAPSGLPRDGAN